MAHFEIQDLTFTLPHRRRAPVSDGCQPSIAPGGVRGALRQKRKWKDYAAAALENGTDALRGSAVDGSSFAGSRWGEVTPEEQASRIGYVMQNPDEQIVTDKVWHELAFGLESLGCDQKTMRARVAEMACYFGIQDWFHRDVDSLSGGQKQLLNLASVMAMQPEVLILDEPTSQLDPIAASDFLNTVRKINLELGTTVIMTEHRLEDIFPVADRAVVMESGKIIAADTPRKNRQPPVGAGPRYVFRHAGPGAGLYGAQGTGPCPPHRTGGQKLAAGSLPEAAGGGVTAGSALPMGGEAYGPIPEGAVVSLRKK